MTSPQCPGAIDDALLAISPVYRNRARIADGWDGTSADLASANDYLALSKQIVDVLFFSEN